MAKRESAASRLRTEEGDPEFQMAPMIDVIFQLLIFFLCVTTLHTVRRVEVELPFASSATKPEEGIGTAIINMKWQGLTELPEVTVNGVKKTMPELTPFLKEIYKLNPDVRVMLRADRRVRYRQIHDVMTACSEAGIGKITFVALQTELKRPSQ